MENKIDRSIEIWKETVGVQKHFNELSIKIRGLAITVFGALLGAVGFSLKEDLTFNLWGKEFRVAVFVLIALLIVWIAFYLMDRHWYHRLLYGAIKHGMKIEDSLKGEVPNITLTESIGDESPIQIWKFCLHSTHKIDIFYGLGVFVILAFILVFI